MKVVILGAGLSAISLAFFLQKKDYIEQITLLEKDEVPGGLCRSYRTKSIEWDVGPHIIFSKDKEVLDFMNNLLGENLEKHRRSNRIIHDKRFVQYPFENDLSKLSDVDKNICLNGFLNNPYENYEANNMLQFFLKTFGEGITNMYLRPYNEKIWKFDPSFMDTQMVNRIPKPPKEDIIKSASGVTVDGYTHQLYFTYPKVGGTEALVKNLLSKLNGKVTIKTNSEVTNVSFDGASYSVTAGENDYSADLVVSTIPLNEMVEMYRPQSSSVPEEIIQAGKELKHNSIAIAIVNVKNDFAGDNYAFMVADKEVIFHRISKLDFMGGAYRIEDSATYMIEVTYRKGDIYDEMSDDVMLKEIYNGLSRIGFINDESEVNFADIKRFEYAYVIYDLYHKKNKTAIVDYLKSQGILVNGRFGSYEYLNMDAIIRQSLDLAEQI